MQFADTSSAKTGEVVAATRARAATNVPIRRSMSPSHYCLTRPVDCLSEHAIPRHWAGQDLVSIAPGTKHASGDSPSPESMKAPTGRASEGRFGNALCKGQPDSLGRREPDALKDRVALRVNKPPVEFLGLNALVSQDHHPRAADDFTALVVKSIDNDAAHV